MVPALTVCPANLLTPSLWLWLSRPLRLWAAPFLCAICCLLFLLAPRFLHRLYVLYSRGEYLIDVQAGKKLAVAVLPAIAYLRFILENDYFLAFAVLLDRGHYSSPVDMRFTDRDIIAVGNKQHFVQFNGAALIRFQTVDFYRLAFGYFILFATCFNYRVNIQPPKNYILPNL
jgi:hypothetical protein